MNRRASHRKLCERCLGWYTDKREHAKTCTAQHGDEPLYEARQVRADELPDREAWQRILHPPSVFDDPDWRAADNERFERAKAREEGRAEATGGESRTSARHEGTA